jgi:hypothetical protein
MATPKPKAFWPLTISAANGKTDFDRGGVKVATIAAATYYSAAELAAAVVVALEAADATPVWACSVSATGRVTVSADLAFVLLFSTGANAAASARDVLGFGAVDTASATSATGQYQHQAGWYADRAVRRDSKPRAERLIAGDVSHAGLVRSVQFGDVRELRAVELTMLRPEKAKISREGANVNEAIERLWRDGAGRFRWWPDAADEATYVDYALDIANLATFDPPRDRSDLERYSLAWVLRRFVA